MPRWSGHCCANPTKTSPLISRAHLRSQHAPRNRTINLYRYLKCLATLSRQWFLRPLSNTGGFRSPTLLPVASLIILNNLPTHLKKRKGKKKRKRRTPLEHRHHVSLSLVQWPAWKLISSGVNSIGGILMRRCFPSPSMVSKLCLVILSSTLFLKVKWFLRDLRETWIRNNFRIL